MADLQPRVQAPGTVAKGEIFQIRTLISHPMETGLRHDPAGKLIPRKIINRFTCRYNGNVIFEVDLHEGMAGNPYLAFNVRASDSGKLQFAWEEDGGAVFTLDQPLTVGA
jgi:sulfur-oxidizing protein SoxZ